VAQRERRVLTPKAARVPEWSPLAIGSYLVHCMQNEVI
jgi:hypothetical protein